VLFAVCADNLQNVIGGSLLLKRKAPPITQRSSVMHGWSVVTAGCARSGREHAESARRPDRFVVKAASL